MNEFESENIHIYGCVVFTRSYDEIECAFLEHGTDGSAGCAHPHAQGCSEKEEDTGGAWISWRKRPPILIDDLRQCPKLQDHIRHLCELGRHDRVVRWDQEGVPAA